MFPVRSLDKVPKFFQLKLQRVNAQLNDGLLKGLLKLTCPFKYYQSDFIEICVFVISLFQFSFSSSLNKVRV